MTDDARLRVGCRGQWEWGKVAVGGGSHGTGGEQNTVRGLEGCVLQFAVSGWRFAFWGLGVGVPRS